jgi:putative two-component system response regulator
MGDIPAGPAKGNLLVVDDTPANLELLSQMLGERGYRVRPVLSGELALKSAAAEPPDLVLLDIRMPGMDGFEVCRRLKRDEKLRDIPVIFLSALTDTEEKIRAFDDGGVDYVTKPFQIQEIEARVQTHLKLRRALLDVARYNAYLEELVGQKVREISDSQFATIFAMVKLSESRDDETGTHIWRVRDYCRVLAAAMRDVPEFRDVLTERFVEDLYNAAPLHDIGKVGIPDAILLKPDRHTPDETRIMKTHTTIGARTLREVSHKYPENTFLSLGAQIAASHHERWDGSGYPEALQGEAIPLVAQIMAVADVYDALRSPRKYKKAFGHEPSVKTMIDGDGRTMPSHFHPRILHAFKRCGGEFDAVYARFGG